MSTQGQKIKKIGFGGAGISGSGAGYGFGAISEVDAIKLVSSAVEQGIYYFDTAPIYGFGESEKRLGKALKFIERDQFYLISKAGVTWDSNKRVDVNNSKSVVLKMLEQSLRDLRVDCIDAYLIHWPDPRHDIRDAIEVLVKAQQQGKIQKIGLSNSHHEDLIKAREVATIEVFQGEWNLFSEEQDDSVVSLKKHDDEFTMGWGTLDKGILSGRVDKSRKFTDHLDARSWAPWWKKQDQSKKFAWVENIQKLLDENEEPHTLLELAIGGSLIHPNMDCALVGVRSLEQLESLLKALENLPPVKLIKECQKLNESL